MTKANGCMTSYIPLLFLLCAVTAMSTSAQTVKTLLNFDGTTAAGPVTPLTQGIDGSLYGTTYYGGTGSCFDGRGIGCGIVFTLTNDGIFDILYNFQQDKNGWYPTNDLILGDDGNLYGTTNQNTIFKITPSGSLTTMHTFTGPDGSTLFGGLTQGTDGNFYGTTESGGARSNFCPDSCGTIYRMTPSGVLTTLYSFCPQNYCADGENPQGTLAEGLDGNFYGTALAGGLYKQGTIFKVTPNGNFTLLYTYNTPFTQLQPGLILGNDENFYGIASTGLYQITPHGAYTPLPNPGSGLNLPIQGTDGNFYGTTQEGGNSEVGSVFEMPPHGNPSILYMFSGYPSDGSYPIGGLVQATNGEFYGTTYAGGPYPCNYSKPGCGSVFSLNVGLSPFVAFVHGAGRVGRTFGILGEGFVEGTSVSLNGIPVSFTRRLGTLLVATVPPGATTGYVTVTTPTGMLTSNVPFHVIP